VCVTALDQVPNFPSDASNATPPGRLQSIDSMLSSAMPGFYGNDARTEPPEKYPRFPDMDAIAPGRQRSSSVVSAGGGSSVTSGRSAYSPSSSTSSPQFSGSGGHSRSYSTEMPPPPLPSARARASTSASSSSSNNPPGRPIDARDSNRQLPPFVRPGESGGSLEGAEQLPSGPQWQVLMPNQRLVSRPVQTRTKSDAVDLFIFCSETTVASSRLIPPSEFLFVNGWVINGSEHENATRLIFHRSAIRDLLLSSRLQLPIVRLKRRTCHA
jgi:hypothetical protein